MKKSLEYSGYDIEVESRKALSGLWYSDARIEYGSDSISFRMVPYGRDGYDSELQAEEKTIAEAKSWIDQKNRF